MALKRRDFLKTSLAAGNGLAWAASLQALPFTLAADFKLTIMATDWGFHGSYDAFCAKAKAAGYDGIETWTPPGARQGEFLAAVEKHKLKYGFLAGSWGDSYEAHLQEYQLGLDRAIRLNPIYINCHAGKEYFTRAQGRSFVDFSIHKSAESGIPIYHETHRGRLLFAAHVCRDYLREVPDLRLTLDISHWCNVHESLLADQSETVALALAHTDHVHARVGHAESPQVTDPRAPEWAEALQAHLTWWDQVVKHKQSTTRRLTMTAEFGPAHYMATVPYTGLPLADQWDINVHMMQLWRERYGR